MLESLKKISLPFLISFLMLLIFPSFIPQVRLLAFVPFLVLTLANNTLAFSLWLSLIAGLLVDLYSKSTPVGFFALNYTLTSAVIYRYRSYFSQEKSHLFAPYAILYSFVSTLLHFILYALIDMQVRLHILSIITDLLLMPIFDGAYALICVFYPLKLYEKISEEKHRRRFKRLFYSSIRKWKARLYGLKLKRG